MVSVPVCIPTHLGEGISSKSKSRTPCVARRKAQSKHFVKRQFQPGIWRSLTNDLDFCMVHGLTWRSLRAPVPSDGSTEAKKTQCCPLDTGGGGGLLREMSSLPPLLFSDDV